MPKLNTYDHAIKAARKDIENRKARIEREKVGLEVAEASLAALLKLAQGEKLA